MDILEDISDYGAQAFTLHVARNSLPSYLLTCSSPHNTSKYGAILHSPGHLILTPGADFTSHGLIFNYETYNLLGFSSLGLNYQALFLSHKLISVALHGSNFHLATIYIPDSVEHIHSSSSKEEDSSRHIHLVLIQRFTCIVLRCCCTEELRYCICCCIVLQIGAKFSQSFIQNMFS